MESLWCLLIEPSLPETHTARSVETKVKGLGSKRFTSGPLAAVMRESISIFTLLIPRPVNPGCGRNNNIYKSQMSQVQNRDCILEDIMLPSEVGTQLV